MKVKYTNDKALSKQLNTVFSQCNRLFLYSGSTVNSVSHMPQNNTVGIINDCRTNFKYSISNRFFRIECDQEVQYNIFSDEKVLLVLIERFCYFLLRINDQKLSLRLSIKEANLLSFEILLGHIEDADISYMKDALKQKTQGSLGFDLMLASIIMTDLGIEICDFHRNGFLFDLHMMLLYLMFP